jgi:hypothetical protein
MGRPAPLDRPLPERTLAWLYTGPLGQLWGTLADVAELWGRWMLQRLRHRRAARDG